jgi:microcystin degradation protein MlrC
VPRIAIGGLSHETNTYATACLGTTGYGDFYHFRGAGIIDEARGVRNYLGGMIAAAEELRVELVPTYFAIASPAGTIAQEAYDAVLAELREALCAAGRLDAVVLELHGAGVAERVADIETDVARMVREALGPGVPIVATLDLHGNITAAMAQSIDLMFGVELYPHTDMWERGHEAMTAAVTIQEGRLRPVTWVEPLPMLLTQFSTDFGPAARVNELCREVEKRPGVVDCTFFHGFPYSDTPNTRASVVVATDGDPGLARECAREVAGEVWRLRESFTLTTRGPREALEEALRLDVRPVVLNETSDNCGGGAPGDGTHVLRAVLDAAPAETCFGVVFDPAVVELAGRAGPGATIRVELGGHHDDLHGAPISAEATVRHLTDGRFRLRGGMGDGDPQDIGPTARLVINGVDVLVAARRSQVFDPEIFLLHGIDVTRYRLVVVKSAQHFRAGFRDVAAAIVTADSPGLTTLDVTSFPRTQCPRPLWPLDLDARYPVPAG